LSSRGAKKLTRPIKRRRETKYGEGRKRRESYTMDAIQCRGRSKLVRSEGLKRGKLGQRGDRL